jgi:hypothetical protein
MPRSFICGLTAPRSIMCRLRRRGCWYAPHGKRGRYGFSQPVAAGRIGAHHPPYHHKNVFFQSLYGGWTSAFSTLPTVSVDQVDHPQVDLSSIFFCRSESDKTDKSDKSDKHDKSRVTHRCRLASQGERDCTAHYRRKLTQYLILAHSNRAQVLRSRQEP